MTPQPQRRNQRRTHLDASVAPVERALLARAEALDDEAWKIAELRAGGLCSVRDEATVLHIAAEFRALAEELHWL